MNTLSYKTISANKQTVEQSWHVIDAEGEVLGRMCTAVATLLRGKHKPSYTPHVDCGDFVIILNVDKVKLTGNKWAAKEYIKHTGYPGGQRKITAEEVAAKKPEFIIENAVKGMLPKNKLGRAMFKKMFLYTGSDHPHIAQQPKEFKIQ